MDLNYEIRYLKAKDITKLEKYLHDVSVKDLGVDYFFKFTSDRTHVEISNKDNRKTIITLQKLLDDTWKKLLMFFKFKDLELGDINKVDPISRDQFFSKIPKRTR